MTEAQIYRVRRMLSGTKYHVSWDGRYAWEMRRETKYTYNPVAGKSVLAMFKRGWVEFKSTAKKEIGCHYEVKLSDLGYEKAKTSGAIS